MKNMYKKILTGIVYTVVFFVLSSSNIFGANCVPPSDQISSSCTIESTQNSYCEGLYGELDSTPTCVYNLNSTGVDIKNNYCRCNIQFVSYKCGSSYKGVYNVNNVSLRMSNSCMPPGYVLDPWYSNITKLQSTDLSACQTWCGMVSTIAPTSCQGQYYGKPQCDARGSLAYGKGGTCQLNPALGTINPSNPNDPINAWKWSYCKSALVPTVIPTMTPTMTPTPVPTVTPIPTPTVVPTSCQGQYYGKPQCDSRGLLTYGKGGTCQLNPALGTINPSNPNDPINTWKWSYCR